jgi:hypothetical protein
LIDLYFRREKHKKKKKKKIDRINNKFSCKTKNGGTAGECKNDEKRAA